MTPFNLHLAQLNFTVGDIAGNAGRVRAAYARAKTEGAELVVFPELCLIGYPPEDLIFTPKLRRDAMVQAHELATLTKDGPAMLLGCVWEEQGREGQKAKSGAQTNNTSLYNAALLLDEGEIKHIQYKHHLPNYGVFDEKRVFERGALPEIIEWRGRRLGVLICEDLWGEEASVHLASQRPDLIVCINASPFEQGKQARREALALAEATKAGCPLIYLNQVGGQDELVFDGGSFVVDAQGEEVERLAFFEEEVRELGIENRESRKMTLQIPDSRLPVPDSYSLLYQAMQTGLRDYVNKNGFPGVVIGLSGGIDSALTAVICTDALGAGRVHCVMLPSPYTSQISLDDAAQLARNLGVRYDILPISPGMEAAEAMLGGMDGVPTGVAFENIQSRLRGMLLMAISNSTGALLITTGNKSEMATGYATLYGDMCGAFSVLKDVYKTEVFALSRWRNEHGHAYGSGRPEGGATGKNLIPERTITRPPSAELREGQVDEDSLPPYETLDKILFAMVEERLSVDDIVAKGYDRAVVEKVARLLYMSEYKRRQAPPGVKLSRMAFGRDRRFPLTNRFTL